MPYYSKDGEALTVSFNKKEVEMYCQICGRSYDGTLPELMCGVLWAKFESYQQFISDKVLLKETEVHRYSDIQVDTLYTAILTSIEQRQIKQHTKYVYQLTLHQQTELLLTIKQTFIQEVRSNEI